MMRTWFVSLALPLMIAGELEANVACAQTSLYSSDSLYGSGSLVDNHSSGLVPGLPLVADKLSAGRNSLGYSTGYSAVTTTSERATVFGAGETVYESTTRLVPNDFFGNPIRHGMFLYNQPNSAGRSTGYSIVTSTSERRNPLGGFLGNAGVVTETTTQVVPNDALGNPIRPFGSLWP